MPDPFQQSKLANVALPCVRRPVHGANWQSGQQKSAVSSEREYARESEATDGYVQDADASSRVRLLSTEVQGQRRFLQMSMHTQMYN